MIDNSYYVGQSWNIYSRWCDYKALRCESQPRLYEYLVLNGVKNYKFEILVRCSKDISQESLDNVEDYFIKYYDTPENNKLNLRGGGSNGKMSEESNVKNRERNIKYVYKIMTPNGDVETVYSLKQWCQSINIGWSMLSETIYGYDRRGNKLTSIRGYKILSKKYYDKNLDNNILQEQIKNEIENRLNNRKMNNYVDFKTDEFHQKMSKQIKAHPKVYKYTILNIESGLIEESTNLSEFCRNNNLKSLTSLINTLYGMTNYGRIFDKYCNYKILSKHYIDENKDDNILSNEISKEIAKRTSCRIEQQETKLKNRRPIRIYDIINLVTNEIYHVENLIEFCRNHNLTDSVLYYTYIEHYTTKKHYKSNKNFKIIKKYYI